MRWTRWVLKVFGCLVPRVGEFVRVLNSGPTAPGWLSYRRDHLQGALTWLRVTGFAIPHPLCFSFRMPLSLCRTAWEAELEYNVVTECAASAVLRSPCLLMFACRYRLPSPQCRRQRQSWYASLKITGMHSPLHRMQRSFIMLSVKVSRSTTFSRVFFHFMLPPRMAVSQSSPVCSMLAPM